MVEVENIPGYFVTANGEVYSSKSGTYMRGSLNKYTGYRSVMLRRPDGTVSSFYVHRLVANSYIPNPRDLPQVNHIDGNKQHNRSTNL